MAKPPNLKKSWGESAPSPNSRKKKHPPPLSLRLNDEERAQLEKDAGNLTLSAYMRLRLFGDDAPRHRTRGKRPVEDHEALARALALLGRSNIANNLNQLTKAAHSGTLPTVPEIALYLEETRDHVASMRAELLRALGLREHGQ